MDRTKISINILSSHEILRNNVVTFFFNVQVWKFKKEKKKKKKRKKPKQNNFQHCVPKLEKYKKKGKKVLKKRERQKNRYDKTIKVIKN